MNRCGVLRRAGAPPATLGPRCVLAFFLLLPANEHRVRPSKGEPTVPRVQGRRHPLAVREKFEASCFHVLHSLDGRNSDLRLFLRGQLFETRCGALLLFVCLFVERRKIHSYSEGRFCLDGRRRSTHPFRRFGNHTAAYSSSFANVWAFLSTRFDGASSPLVTAHFFLRSSRRSLRVRD